MSDDDFFIDDILNDVANRKKKKNSGRKGRRAENELAKQLMDRFPGKQFSRVVGSGNRWAQAKLTEQARQVLTGDLTCPEGFRFCIESKKGYDIELCSAFSKNHPKLDEFLEQASSDAGRVNRRPLLCWKKDRQPTLAVIKETDLGNHLHRFSHRMHYGDWIMVSFDQLLTLPDRFFFDLECQ